jgi:hypothetical protein
VKRSFHAVDEMGFRDSSSGPYIATQEFVVIWAIQVHA